MNKPIAVLISDCHYSLNTLELADTAFRAAIDKAAELKVPLIDAGDITNDKAILRGEVVNALLKTVGYARDKNVEMYILVGNHSLINEKNNEGGHVLNFLQGGFGNIRHSSISPEIIDRPKTVDGFNFIPYQSNYKNFYFSIKNFKKGDIVIAHQGTMGGQLGDYVKDSTAINPDDILDWKVFLGHYHKHYVLKNTVSIGNPYTLTFGEANDGPKGFLILNSDGSFTREILDLRKHVILNYNMDQLGSVNPKINPKDLVWVKLTGKESLLKKITKKHFLPIIGHMNFKLDLIPETSAVIKNDSLKSLTDLEIFNKLITELNETDQQKAYIKELAYDLIEGKSK